MKGNGHVLNLREMLLRCFIQLFFTLCIKAYRKLVDAFAEFLIQSKVDLIWCFFLLALGHMPCKNHFIIDFN